MKNKLIIILTFFMIFLIIFFIVTKVKVENNNNSSNVSIKNEAENRQEERKEDIKQDTKENDDINISDTETVINLIDTDGYKTNYDFEYNEEKFSAIYKYDNWKIIDSYKITNRKDMTSICEALLNEHKIHGNDMISYRTAEDMVYEWVQHNLAYKIFPDDNEFKVRAKDVDFDPIDQNKNIIEMYESKTGKKFDLKEYL